MYTSGCFKQDWTFFSEALCRDEALFLLSEVEKWRQEVDMLNKKNQEQIQLERDRIDNLKVSVISANHSTIIGQVITF